MFQTQHVSSLLHSVTREVYYQRYLILRNVVKVHKVPEYIGILKGYSAKMTLQPMTLKKNYQKTL